MSSCWRATAAMASTDAPRYVELSGPMPLSAHPACATYFGLYKRLPNDVNGKPSYGKVGDEAMALWYHDTCNGCWAFGQSKNLGTALCCIGQCGDLFHNPSNKWAYGDANTGAYMYTNVLRATALIAATDDDEVTVVATSTPETRNAEKRKHALDLELFEPKRAKTPSVELETIVAKRRSVLSPDVDQKVAALMQPNFEEFLANKISAAELEARKAAAREAAEKEDARLKALDAAHAKYTAAVAARVAHEEAGEKLRAAEDAAEAELRKLLPAEAGPSGVVKSEA